MVAFWLMQLTKQKECLDHISTMYKSNVISRRVVLSSRDTSIRGPCTYDKKFFGLCRMNSRDGSKSPSGYSTIVLKLAQMINQLPRFKCTCYSSSHGKIHKYIATRLSHFSQSNSQEFAQIEYHSSWTTTTSNSSHHPLHFIIGGVFTIFLKGKSIKANYKSKKEHKGK